MPIGLFETSLLGKWYLGMKLASVDVRSFKDNRVDMCGGLMAMWLPRTQREGRTLISTHGSLPSWV